LLSYYILNPGNIYIFEISNQFYFKDKWGSGGLKKFLDSTGCLHQMAWRRGVTWHLTLISPSKTPCLLLHEGTFSSSDIESIKSSGGTRCAISLPIPIPWGTVLQSTIMARSPSQTHPYPHQHTAMTPNSGHLRHKSSLPSAAACSTQ